MEYFPCGHRLLLKPVAIEEVDEAYAAAQRMGFKIPELDGKKIDKNAVNRGTIIRLGPNCWKAFDDGTPWAAEGDLVLYARYAGTKVKNGEEEFLICSDEDIVCVIKE